MLKTKVLNKLFDFSCPSCYFHLMHERIAVTGSRGVIGSFLTPELSSDYQVTELSLLEVDVRDYGQVVEKLKGNRAVIHLAWNSKTENFRNGQKDPDNKLMAVNVYKASKEMGVERVIMASSIHADDFYNWNFPPYLSVDHKPAPDSSYGETKIEIEQVGKDFAKQGLEIICIRFGGINPKNEPPARDTPRDRVCYLSHNDCISLIRAILKADEIPDNFVLMYAVSDNEGRIHNISNPFGWVPKDGVKKLR